MNRQLAQLLLAAACGMAGHSTAIAAIAAGDPASAGQVVPATAGQGDASAVQAPVPSGDGTRLLLELDAMRTQGNRSETASWMGQLAVFALLGCVGLLFGYGVRWLHYRSKLAPPPIPQGLRDLLKDHPQHLAELQAAFDRFALLPRPRLQPYDEAVWMLEDVLSSFIVDAQAELDAAEDSGSPSAIYRAGNTLQVMHRARSRSVGGGLARLDDLQAYFEANKAAFGGA